MTNREHIIYYTITAVVFVGIVVCSLLFHNPGQPTNAEIISTIVIAAAAVVTAGATIVLAVITSRYVGLTDSLLKATYKPQIFVSLVYEEFIGSSGSALCWQHICVKNIGVGPARKVEFGRDLSFKTQKSTALKEIGFLKEGIDALAPGQEEIEPVPLESVSHEEYPLVLITVTYRDSMSGDYNDEFTLNFNDRTKPR
jgi:hypothetical protein